MKFLHIKSIQLKIALWASICLIVSGIVIVSYSATTARITAIKAAEERAIAEARIQAGIVKAEIEVGLDTARARAQELSAVRQLKNRLIINREQVNAMMRQVLVENPQYIGVWTLWEPNAFDGQDARYANTKTYGMTGRYFPYWNRGTGEISVEPIVDFDTGDWYQEPKRNKREYVSDLYTYPVMGKDVLMISIVAPIVANGTFYGVAGEDIPVTFLQELADKVNIYKGAGKLFLIGNNGKLVAATGQPEMRGRPLSELMAMQVSDEYVKVLQTGQERIKLTRDHVEAIVPIHFGRTLKPWAAMVILPSHVIVAPANELLWRLVAIALVMMLAGVGALWLVARHIARPIRQVTEIALRVASGDLTQTVVIGERHDELGKLAKGFNYMTQQLRSLYGTLEQRLHELKQASQSLGESEERFRSLVETSSDWIWEVNEQGIVTYASPKLNELLGYTPAEVMGKYLFDMMPPEEADRIRMQFSEIARSCRPIVNLVTTNQHKKGVSVILEICGVPVFDQAGVFHGYRGVARDITERKRAEADIRQLNQELEARVIERTRELELANREMEAFTYSVSHDLRAPLRAIDGFSTALLEDYADKLDEEGKSYLRYLHEGSREMSDLIDGLLDLSRSTRGELSVERVDLSAMADTVVNELRKAEHGRRVSVHIAPGMEAFADRQLLRVVVENLIGNAWKYTGRNNDGRIEFSLETQHDETVYFVRDNGAGFDMAYAGKLFLPFQRLHKTTEFPGTGIGLATVERIIHRHNGRIWAEGTVGAGAAFYFTLGQKGNYHEKLHNTGA